MEMTVDMDIMGGSSDVDMEVKSESALVDMEVNSYQEHNTGGSMAAVLFVPQKLTEEKKRQARKNIGAINPDYVTPQMYGAIADGVADDTEAVQAALDAGKNVYFPAGRYKVTRQITATKSCKISMCKPYPIAWSGGKGDYPLTADDNWMGARIESYASDGYGLLIGDGVQVDGLYMRAMKGFSGVLFRCDGTLGCATYPSQIRLSHMQLDCAYYDINPVSMFDFAPHGSYFAVLDDITIGSLRGRQICDYGFRVILDSDGGWANSMRVNNLCIDLCADYPLYLDGNGVGMGNWIFEGLSIQAYPYKADDAGYMYRPGHVNVITLNNVQHPVFMGCHIWDLHAATVLQDIIHVDNCDDISCFGCNEPFEAVETVLKSKLQEASVSVKNLSLYVDEVEETGANRLTITDGENAKSVDIPAATVSDEQVANGVSDWLDDNAEPKPQVGRNKFNPLDNDTINGSINDDGTVYYDQSVTTSNYIAARQGDIVGISKNGQDTSCAAIYCYDADKVLLGQMSGFASSGDQTITIGGTEYIRVSWYSNLLVYVDRANTKIMVTVNDTLDTSWNNRLYEPYKVTYVGGLGGLIVLQAPNGTQYKLSISNDGIVSATPMGSAGGAGDDEIITDVLWNLSGRSAVVAPYTAPAGSKTIDFDTYILGLTRLGQWNGGVAPTVVLDGENFSMTRKQGGYGIGVPYKLTPWSTYQITCAADGAASIYMTYYDDAGVFRDMDQIATISAAGTLTGKCIPKDYKYQVIGFYADTNATTKFSDIALEYVS